MSGAQDIFGPQARAHRRRVLAVMTPALSRCCRQATSFLSHRGLSMKRLPSSP